MYMCPTGICFRPSLFSLANIFHKHQTLYHCYADDTQLYLPVKSDCLGEVKSWLADNFLQLNDSKTEVL